MSLPPTPAPLQCCPQTLTWIKEYNGPLRRQFHNLCWLAGRKAPPSPSVSYLLSPTPNPPSSPPLLAPLLLLPVLPLGPDVGWSQPEHTVTVTAVQTNWRFNNRTCAGMTSDHWPDPVFQDYERSMKHKRPGQSKNVSKTDTKSVPRL